MLNDDKNLEIVKAIITLSNQLGIGVVAEGIEDEFQLAKLKELGCEFGQGYYLSTPLNSREMMILLNDIDINTGKLGATAD
jgi:EAL domain-containing protein (putative c-di-GMP-specific phosphodiesterase class I)